MLPQKGSTTLAAAMGEMLKNRAITSSLTVTQLIQTSSEQSEASRTGVPGVGTVLMQGQVASFMVIHISPCSNGHNKVALGSDV